MTNHFEPSDIPERHITHDPLPFVDLFGKAEAEQAAACMVRTLQRVKRTWSPILPTEIGDMLNAEIRDATERGVRHAWNNPFFRPDVDALIAKGFARWVDHPTLRDRGRPVEFTEAGIAKLATRVSR